MAEQWAQSGGGEPDEPAAAGGGRRWAPLAGPTRMLAMLGFVVGVGTMAAVAGLSDAFGGDATPAAIETAFDQGFTAGEREAQASAQAVAQRASVVAAAESVGYTRGLRQGLVEAGTVRVPSFTVSAGQDTDVVFTIEDGLAGCGASVPGWLLVLIGLAGCESEDGARAPAE